MKLVNFNDVLKLTKDFFDGCLPTEDRDSVARDFISDLMQIPAAVEIEWIPIDSENLPPVKESVLVCGPQGGLALAYIQFYTPNGKAFWKRLGTSKPCHPVAWMYPPKPYMGA